MMQSERCRGRDENIRRVIFLIGNRHIKDLPHLASRREHTVRPVDPVLPVRLVLLGGASAYLFHFSKRNGRDTIADFVQGTDHSDVSGWTGMSDFNGVKSHAHNDGSDVVIEMGIDSLTIKDTRKADLTGADFLFPTLIRTQSYSRVGYTVISQSRKL